MGNGRKREGSGNQEPSVHPSIILYSLCFNTPLFSSFFIFFFVIYSALLAIIFLFFNPRLGSLLYAWKWNQLGILHCEEHKYLLLCIWHFRQKKISVLYRNQKIKKIHKFVLTHTTLVNFYLIVLNL